MSACMCTCICIARLDPLHNQKDVVRGSHLDIWYKEIVQAEAWSRGTMHSERAVPHRQETLCLLPKDTKEF